MPMALSQLQLEAFLEVARVGSFTKAAAQLHLTQSALSHRIKNLEDTLETSLFLRQGSGVKLTEAGMKLMMFCRVQSQAEEEFIKEWAPKKNVKQLSGTLRIGGTSTLMRSTVVPCLSEMLSQHPEIKLELYTRELRELPGLLTHGQIDFLVICGSAQIPGALETLLGHEENVMIQSKKKNAIEDVYLDHDMEDQTTFEFFKINGQKAASLKRSFMDDIYGIIDGVAQGLGRAVAPMHLLSDRNDVKVVRGFKPMRTEVYLYQMKQPYYTKLHQAADKQLCTKIPSLL